MSEASSSNRPPVEEAFEAPTIPPNPRQVVAVRTDVRLQLADYELIREMARGGMGVVYEARQKSVDRLVAVKMMLTGEFADAAEIERFRTEVSAAGALDHPNIVPIYEVGQDAGRPFFSMKLIDGGSLSGRKMTQKEAAATVAVVARAVHYAHQHGIIHRDLKPANILLDRTGRPYVTDFGLAKKLNSDSGMTRTGVLMGTPAYMPPEQAGGRSRDITTLVDVYSLGAILYELLAGQPPFQAETAVDTVLRVLDKEPTPPHALNPLVDRDLEAVCLKCLAKDPGHRYASAALLADDLHRWLAGDPVSVEPPSGLIVMRRWMRKNFGPARRILVLSLVFAGLLSLLPLSVVRDAAGEVQAVYQTNFPTLEPPRALRLLFSLPTRPLRVVGWSASLVFILFIGMIVARAFRSSDVTGAIRIGAAMGLATATFALLLGFGWVEVLGNALRPTQSDLNLLYDAVRASEKGTLQGQRMARQVLSARYPDLQDDAQPVRATLNKVVFDTIAGIPGGIWAGLGTTLLLIFLPCVGQTALATHLHLGERRSSAYWKKRSKGEMARAVGRYLEVVLPTSLVLLLVGGAARDLSVWGQALAVPGGLQVLLIIPAMVVGVLSIPPRWPSGVRYAIYAAVALFVLLALFRRDVGDPMIHAAAVLMALSAVAIVGLVRDWSKRARALLSGAVVLAGVGLHFLAG
jgi:eukaryotic-like serine/threonine-protein kinase